AEDGIRDFHVTGVQTCALPISHRGQVLVVAVVMKGHVSDFRAALAKAGVSELQLPDRYAGQEIAKVAHSMEERSQVVPKRLATEIGRASCRASVSSWVAAECTR